MIMYLLLFVLAEWASLLVNINCPQGRWGGGVHSQEMPCTEVPLGWVAIFELRYRDGSQFLPSGRQVKIFKLWSLVGILMGLTFALKQGIKVIRILELQRHPLP